MTARPPASSSPVNPAGQSLSPASCSPLVLSLFPGIGLLDRGFEAEGFVIVRGPDPLWGGDVRNFHVPAGRFDGLIGGPPCQAFSPLVNVNRAQGNAIAENLIPEFERVVAEAQPEWFVMENSPRAPLPVIAGYEVRDVVLNNRWLGQKQNRVRRFSFGTRDGRKLHPQLAALEHMEWEAAVTTSVGGRRRSVNPTGKGRQNRTREASEVARDRPFEVECELQGLPKDFLKDSPLTREGKKRVVGNGVPLPMGRAIASAVRAAMYSGNAQSPDAGCDRDASARRSATACSASPENERYLWMQLENARLERERARAALREIREGIMNEEENGLREADVILSIIDRALSPEKLSPPKEKTP